MVTLHTVTSKAFLRALCPDAGVAQRQQPNRLLGHFMLTRRRFCSMDELTDALWGDKEDGGPNGPERCIHTYICWMRQAGVSIEKVWGIGYRLADVAA